MQCTIAGDAAVHLEDGMNDLNGKQAFEFSLPDTSGRMHRLADFRGSWLLLMFHRHLG